MATERFLLKDHLYNEAKVQKISQEIRAAFPLFEQKKFEKKVLVKFPELELMERVYWIRDCLRTFMPADYRQAVVILLKSLPPQNDPERSDDDFGDYIYAAYGSFVAEYGANKKDVVFSLKALHVLTTRFSCEFPLRTYLNQFPAQTLVALSQWVTDEHYQVRRLVSEGTRPTLPWGKNITLDYQVPLQYLDILHADPARYVTRSVANHLNDIAKKDPDLVIKTLKRWQKQKLQKTSELEYITRHSLRSLVKSGHAGALALLGFIPADIEVSQSSLTKQTIQLGEVLELSFSITSNSQKNQWLLIDYIVYFQKANGTLAPKTFKITKTNLPAGETLTFSKRHPFKSMTTRKLYFGKHQFEPYINGKTYGKTRFNLVK